MATDTRRATVIEDGQIALHLGTDAAGAVVIDMFCSHRDEIVGSVTITRAELDRALKYLKV